MNNGDRVKTIIGDPYFGTIIATRIWGDEYGNSFKEYFVRWDGGFPDEYWNEQEIGPA